jgi:glutathione S-transferase
MDAHLSKQDYFAGSDFSIADITYMPYVEYGMMTPVKESFAKYASFMAWWNRVSERASWRKATGRG